MPLGGGGGGGGGTAQTNFVNFHASSTTALGSANQTWYESFQLPFKLTFGHISVNIGVADAGNFHDVGIYDMTGALKADIGPTHWPSTGVQRFANVQGNVTLNAGVYLFAWTSQGTTATLSFTNQQDSWSGVRTLAGASGGQLQSSITAPVSALDVICWYFILD